MEGDPGSGFSPRLFDWNSFDTITPNMQPNLGNPTTGFPFQNTTPDIISRDCVLPFCGVSGLPQPQLGQSSEHLGWFYCWPLYRQALSPATRHLPLKDGLSVRANSSKLYEGVDVGGVPKFFVFDQSGGQTTLVFVPENNGVPMPRISMATSKQLGITASRGEGPGDETVSERWGENGDIDAGSEMHEDTEELNALLYSDDESEYSDDGDDDDVTSTGHSPSNMTDHLYPDDNMSEKVPDEVDSSLWPPSKKRNLVTDQHDPRPLTDAAAAENHISNFDSDNAISSSGESENIYQNHAIKRARICETVSVLQSLVPGAKGKNPVLILDEAIGYLKLLKLKAAALGLSQLSKK